MPEVRHNRINMRVDSPEVRINHLVSADGADERSSQELRLLILEAAEELERLTARVFLRGVERY
jgi:hypothetical protein